jgi:hypothetical protein
MASCASSSDDPDSSQRQVNVVMDQQNILFLEMEKINAGSNRISTPIHKGHGPKKNHIGILKPCLGELSLKTPAIQTDVQRFGPQIHNLKPYVVACIPVL